MKYHQTFGVVVVIRAGGRSVVKFSFRKMKCAINLNSIKRHSVERDSKSNSEADK